MIRFLVLLLALIITGATASRAQTAPKVEVEFEETEAIPGQPLSLRLTVLVPTWMTTPVVFPSFEWPNLMVRLPERATTPISRKVDGDTWSGVSRHYRLVPMIPGTYRIPPQDVVVTWSDPDNANPRQDVVTTPEIAFAGVVPPGAEALDPFIAAETLSLTQEVTGAKELLALGDSVTRVITAKITGASPMFLPALVPDTAVEGVAQYPAEPVMAETGQRGAMAGTRTETVTYIAQSGGAGSAAEVTLDWYNLDSGKIETASVEGVALKVDAPVASTAPDLDPRLVAALVVLVIANLGLLAIAWRYVWPKWQQYQSERRSRQLASEHWAYSQLAKVVADRDFGALWPALDLWASRLPRADPRLDPDVASAVSALGAARYGVTPDNETAAWRQLHRALADLRSQAPSATKSQSQLPPLNPA